MTRAQREKAEKRQREQRWMLEDARAHGVIAETADELRACAGPCPTILGWPFVRDGYCLHCALALARAGIVLDARG